MLMTTRYIKVGMVASIALFFTVIAVDNILDYETNWQFVQHVLSMDTIFPNSQLMWRAITNPTLQKIAYISIIAWQFLTAILCWIGCFKMLSAIYGNQTRFINSKNIAYLGLFLGFLLYAVGFIIIAGEWFAMWQSKTWNGQHSAGLFVSLILFVMIFLKDNE